MASIAVTAAVVATLLVAALQVGPDHGALQAAVAREPGSWGAWYEAARSLEASDPEEALAALETAMDLSAKDPDVYRRASRLAASFGSFGDARIYAELGLYDHPQDAELKYLAAQAYLSMKPPRAKEAKKHLDGLPGVAPPPPVVPDEDRALLGSLRYKKDGATFQVRTNVSEAVTEYVSVMAEKIFDRYLALFPGLARPVQKPRIFIFDQKHEYTRMLERYRSAYAETEGLATRTPLGIKVLACMESAQEGGRTERGMDWLRVILLHELNHVAMYCYTGGEIPLWLTEGFAEYTAGSQPMGTHGFKLGSVNRLRADNLKYLAERGVRPPSLRNLTRSGAWSSTGFYEYSWALTYHLLHGDGGAHAARFTRMLELVRFGRGSRAFDEAFAGVDLAALERGYLALATSGI